MKFVVGTINPAKVNAVRWVRIVWPFSNEQICAQAVAKLFAAKAEDVIGVNVPRYVLACSCSPLRLGAAFTDEPHSAAASQISQCLHRRALRVRISVSALICARDALHESSPVTRSKHPTHAGATNRARAALKAHPEADYGIGAEGAQALHCMASVVDEGRYSENNKGRQNNGCS